MKKIKKALNKMHLRKLPHSNHGVVGIVVAVLLIGLLVSVVSILQAVYIPKWMEEREAEHIEQVLVQFSELKLAIDTHSVNRENNTPIATSITLGSKEFPFLMSTRAYGSLEIVDNVCTININYNTTWNNTHNFNVSKSRGYKLGIIKYTSYNAYYIPQEKQSFVYEAGSVITNQTSGNSISVRPSFKPSKPSPSLKRISFKIIDIESYAEKTSYGGYDIVPILTEYNGSAYNDSINYENAKVRFINITSSDYSDAWFTFLNSTLKKEGFIYGYGNDYFISPGNTIVLEFYNNLPEFELTLMGINAQIGPGWVE